MSRYVVAHNVPILDEHVLTDDDGNPLVTVDESKLREIADKANRRVTETGDLVPIVIGHTQDGAPEDKQPEVVGYASEFKIRPFFKTGRKAITATFKFFRHAAHKARKYPRRSVELWLHDWRIDPISLLGATTPERDLGLLRFSKGGARKYRRVIPTMDTKAIVEAVLAALKQTDCWKWLESQVAQEEGQHEEPPMEGEDDLGLMDEEPPMEGDENMDDAGLLDDEEGAPNEPAPEEPKVRMSATSCPGGTNTAVPGMGGMDKKRMQREQGRSRLARYQRAYQGLQAQVEELRIKYQRTQRERDLVQLEAEGFEFDRAEELDYVADLPEQTYTAHLAKIRKRYRKAPVGFSPTFETQKVRSSQQAGRGRDEALQIARYASENGLSYEAAAQALANSTEKVY